MCRQGIATHDFDRDVIEGMVSDLCDRLEAADAKQPEVKPLGWIDTSNSLFDPPNKNKAAYVNLKGHAYYFFYNNLEYNSVCLLSNCSFDEAKAAAETHYREQVLSLLK